MRLLQRKNLSDIARISVAAADIETVTVSYDQEREIRSQVQDLAVEELAYLNVGGLQPEGQALSVIGNAATNVAGAAGDHGHTERKGFPSSSCPTVPQVCGLPRKFYRDERGPRSRQQHGSQEFSPLPACPARFIMNLIGGSGKPKRGRR